MRSIEWLCCRWPLSTLNHLNFYILHCLMHLPNWWSQRLQIWCTGWMCKSLAYGQQTVRARGMVRSCDPLQIFGGSNHITGMVEPKVIKFCTRVSYIILATGCHITNKRGVVMVTWLLNFAVCRDAARRAGLSATGELLVERGWVTLSANFRGNGGRPPTTLA